MSAVDAEQVRHVARLARLDLADEEVERLAEEMGRVLARFAELEGTERDTDADARGEASPGARPGEAAGAGPGPGEEPPPRPDRPDADDLARGPGEIAPEWKDGFFLVPRLQALGGEGQEAGRSGEGG